MCQLPFHCGYVPRTPDLKGEKDLPKKEALTRLVSLNGEYSNYTIVLPEQLSSSSYIQESLKYFPYPITYLKKGEIIFSKDLVSFERVAPSFN